MDKHQCLDCSYCTLHNTWNKTSYVLDYVCTATDDMPVVNISRNHYCEMWKNDTRKTD